MVIYNLKIGTWKTKEGYEILIPIRPYTKKNSQSIRYRNVIDSSTGTTKKVPYIVQSKQYKDYEYSVGYFIKPINIDYAINVEAHYYVPTKGIYDLNNLHSALHDVLTNYNFIKDDNCKIIVSTDGSRVHYDKSNPRTEIFITKETPTFP